MFRGRPSRVVAWSVVTAAVAACASYACTTEDPAAGADASADGAPDRASSDGGVEPSPDGSVADGGDGGPSDAGGDARVRPDANGPGLDDAGCAFNRDCNLALRCECDQGDCRCVRGPRGTGEVGVDKCDGGNDCSSSVCAEGPGGVYYCSDECVTAVDCAGALPKCTDIAFVGRICIRDGG
jgi:hypothetical protein